MSPEHTSSELQSDHPVGLTLLAYESALQQLREAAADAGAVEVHVGESREGRTLSLFRFGNAPVRSFWYAGPHANEPIGVTTLVALAQRLVAEPELLEEAGFDLLLCIDPDAHVRNERWLTGFTGTSREYFTGLFRPASSEYCDWDLPVELHTAAGDFRRESTMPEGRALQRALEISAPRVVMALHNAEIGGSYLHQIGGDADIARALSGILPAHGLTVEPAPIDDPSAQAIAPGIYPLPAITDMYAPLFAQAPDDPLSVLPMGESAMTWSLRFGAVSIVTEVSMWEPTESADAGTYTRAQAAQRSAAALDEDRQWLTDFLTVHSDYLPDTDPYVRSIAEGPGVLGGLNALMLATAQAEGMDEPATAADIRRWIVMLAHSVPQRYAGMLLQALRRHAAPEDVVTAALARFEAGQAWLDGCGLQATGIGTVVDVQIDIGMAAIRQILFTERGDTK